MKRARIYLTLLSALLLVGLIPAVPAAAHNDGTWHWASYSPCAYDGGYWLGQHFYVHEWVSNGYEDELREAAYWWSNNKCITISLVDKGDINDGWPCESLPTSVDTKIHMCAKNKGADGLLSRGYYREDGARGGHFEGPHYLKKGAVLNTYYANHNYLTQKAFCFELGRAIGMDTNRQDPYSCMNPDSNNYGQKRWPVWHDFDALEYKQRYELTWNGWCNGCAELVAKTEDKQIGPPRP